uniref:Protein AAR2 homolog n=1 Tax=Globodera rostochiensis TaxID=31243 RepID=A0A914H0E4_GLORO
MDESQLHRVFRAGEMSQELALELFENGGVLVLKDFPVGCEFGIDYRSWVVGPNFLGMKMIPPGVHFVYFSVPGAPRIAFFHCFQEKEVVLRRWDKQSEDLVPDYKSDEVELGRLRANLKNIDRHLGVYPFSDYRDWLSLSSYITPKIVRRLSPSNALGRISSQNEMVTHEAELEKRMGDPLGLSIVDREHRGRIRFTDEYGLPLMSEGEEAQLHFTQIPQITLAETNLRRAGIDSSDRFLRCLSSVGGDYREVLGEFQFAFIIFLIGQVYEGFDQWKRWIHLVCSCTTALQSQAQFFNELFAVFHFQMKMVPDDFFVDVLARNNFLSSTLSLFFANIEDTPSVDPSLKAKGTKFRALLEKRFNRSFVLDSE